VLSTNKLAKPPDSQVRRARSAINRLWLPSGHKQAKMEKETERESKLVSPAGDHNFVPPAQSLSQPAPFSLEVANSGGQPSWCHQVAASRAR